MPAAILVPNSGPINSARSRQDHVPLAEALDRILHRGVSVQGNVTIGLADVDLLFLDLRLLLGSVDTIWPEGRPPVPAVRPLTPPRPSPPPSETSPSALPDVETRSVAHARIDAGPPIVPKEHRDEPGSSPAQGLVRLVLTLVKLLHEVLERQAVRRMGAGRLTDVQIEDIGTALFAQAEEILRLQRQFGLSDKDLSLDLGVPDGAL
jgi:hypothetical protein